MNMPFRRYALCIVTFLLFTQPLFANSITADFDLDSGLNSIPSVGQVTFSLNGDGTIAATLASSIGGITGFGFDSVSVNLFQSNFSTEVDNTNGWLDSFGYHHSGFYSVTNQPTTMTWTIGAPGDFTTVAQVLFAGNATTQFFLQVGTAEYGANAAPIPEPSTFVLAGLGGLGLVLRAYRRRAACLESI